MMIFNLHGAKSRLVVGGGESQRPLNLEGVHHAVSCELGDYSFRDEQHDRLLDLRQSRGNDLGDSGGLLGDDRSQLVLLHQSILQRLARSSLGTENTTVKMQGVKYSNDVRERHSFLRGNSFRGYRTRYNRLN